MKQVFALVFGWIIIINLFALVANNRVNLLSDTAYKWINPEYTFQQPGWNPVPLHARWDAYFYQNIARDGYSYQGSDQLSNLVFFPIYPLLMGISAGIVAGNLILAGWLVSALFTLLSAIYLYLLVRDFHQEADPLLAVFLLLIFPTAFFLNTLYPESTFLFFSLAAFYHTLKKQYYLSGLFGFLAALTRLNGIFLLLPLVWEYVKTNRQSFIKAKILGLGLIPLGTFSFFLYHYFRFGDIWLFFKVQKLWGRGFSFNPDHLYLATNPAIANFLLDVGFTALILVASYFIAKKLRFSYALYTASSALTILSSGTLMSIGRYALVLFPIFILGARIKNKILINVWILTSSLFLGLYTLLLAAHYWAG